MGFPSNSGGHYDEEFRRRAAGEKLVAMIGDSFSASVVPHAQHFSTLLERHLGVPVANIGLPALGPWEYAILAQREAAPLDPTLVVVQVFLGNDLREAVLRAPRRRAGAWLAPSGLLLATLPPRWVRLWRARGAGPTATPALPTTGATSPTSSSADGGLLEAPMFPEDVYHDIERKRARDLTTFGAPAIAQVVEALQRARDVVPRAAFVVVLIPDEAQVEDALWLRVAADLPGAAHRDRAQRLLAAALTGAGIPYLDLLPVLRAVAPLADGDRHLYWNRDTHWNERGNRVAAEAMAGFLAPYVGGRE